MGDWLDRLTAEEHRQWDEFVARTRSELVGKIADSAMVMSLVPGQPDVKFAVELGFSIMLGKQIIAVTTGGGAGPPEAAGGRGRGPGSAGHRYGRRTARSGPAA